ncbi:hypothetical protein RB195_008519 [Necator americanus]|uniref:Uncharacterized protein n=1 Tax=Necator americanus TaxID=51031 RepID=A0ABR1CSE1_NECAM
MIRRPVGGEAQVALDVFDSGPSRYMHDSPWRLSQIVKALQGDLSKHRQKKILEAAQRRTSLKKYRRDLREYNTLLAGVLSEDGTRISSRREMEIITEKFYSDLSRSSTPVSNPIIRTGDTPPRILPSEVRVTIKSMKPGTTLGPDFISPGSLHEILSEHMTSCPQKGRNPDGWKA